MFSTNLCEGFAELECLQKSLANILMSTMSCIHQGSTAWAASVDPRVFHGFCAPFYGCHEELGKSKNEIGSATMSALTIKWFVSFCILISERAVTACDYDTMISLFGFCVLHPQVRSAKPSWFDSDGSARSWRSAFYKRRCRMSQHERRRFEHWNCWPLRRSSHPYVRQRGVESLHEDLQHWCQLWPWAWKWNCIQNHPKSDVMCHTVSIEIIPSCVENTDLLDFWFSGDLKILKVAAMPTFTSFCSNRTADSCKCDERLGLTWSVPYMESATASFMLSCHLEVQTCARNAD